MKIIAFEPDYNLKHQEVLRALAAGIPGCEVRPLGKYVECDVAIIFGGYKKAFSKTWPKAQILSRHKGNRLLMVESAFVKRGEYWQVGWGGFAGDADFRLPADRGKSIDPSRWKRLDVTTKPWSHDPDGHILLMGQLPRDTQVQDVNHIGWCQQTISYLQAKGYDVKFRPHPRMQTINDYGVPKKLIIKDKLEKALDGCRCVVTWNSTSSIDALIEGIPAIACHPSAMAWDYCGQGLDAVDTLDGMDRSGLFNAIGYAQWNKEEMASGETWRHLNG